MEKKLILDETQLSTQQVFCGELLDVRKDHVRLPNGSSAVREYILHPGAVVIIAKFDDQRIIMERQHRYPLGRDFIELPAGKIDKGEEPLAAAQRELREETGYSAQDWRELGLIHPCVGYANEVMTLYLATGLAWQGGEADPDECLEIFTLPLAEALQAVKSGRITDAKSVIGLFWAEKLALGIWA